MKIIVLHGDDTTKSYERLTRFVETAKKRGWEIVYDDLGVTESLFGNDKLIILKDIKLLTKKSLEALSNVSGTLVIYSEKDIPVTFLKTLPKDTKIEKFELPKILFVFLEAFYPGNSVRCLQLLHELIKSQAVELVFFMLARHLRDLYWISVDTKSTHFQAWQASKLKNQANKFTIQQLKQIISLLSDIDIKVKTSKADLLTSLDLLIVKQLE